MNLKRKVKNFFTLTRKADSGFTLVELIVVIAILAILGGVTVPAYSGYVNKANEAADRQMIADIEQALILGAYSEGYAPGTSIAVGLNMDGAATAKGTNQEGADISNAIETIVERSFGSNWKDSLKLKWDGWSELDQGLILQAMSGVNAAYFSSVPGSSFYGEEGSTADLTAKVDEITAIFANIGEGHAFSLFWPSDFQTKTSGLDYTKTENAYLAANLTVMAAANEIANKGSTVQQAWINSWTGGDTLVNEKDVSDASSYGTGYVAPLVMDYAKQVAFLNYANANLASTNIALSSLNDSYAKMNEALADLAENDEDTNYIEGFNYAIKGFEDVIQSKSALRNLYDEWQKVDETTNKSQAQIDAEAFIASMAAVNALEDNYVNKENAENLNQTGAFAKLGAADILDDMVSYATVNASGDWVVIVNISAEGLPTVAIEMPNS